jgi:hypothetical protein
VDSGGRQSGRHFSSQYTYTEAWCVLFLKVCTYRFKTPLPETKNHSELKTKSQPQARYAAQKLLSRLDDYWLNLRFKEAEIPAAHLLRSVPSQNIHSVLPTITDALDLYHRVKGQNKRTTFFTHSKRSVDYLIKCWVADHWISTPVQMQRPLEIGYAIKD